jgi:hypothetical protein
MTPRTQGSDGFGGIAPAAPSNHSPENASMIEQPYDAGLERNALAAELRQWRDGASRPPRLGRAL